MLRAIAAVVAGYALAAALGWPQAGTRKVIEAAHHDHAEVAHGPTEGGHAEPAASPPSDHAVPTPPLHTIAPFALLLGAVALFPLIPWTEDWWESNLHRLYVAVGLAVLTLLYYLVWHEAAVVAHWPAHAIVPHDPHGLNEQSAAAVLANAILHEYIPFIVLLFSLFTISGGIRIEGDLPARPVVNGAIIAIGGLLASFIGTTGAAMLLIRPLLETNRRRRHVRHTVVFFIFVVCNCGGCLLPIGDPPLFLGYLRGVGFLWTFTLWPAWLFVNLTLLTIYYVWDRFWAYPREARTSEQPVEFFPGAVGWHGLRFHGLWPGVPLLMGVVLSVALFDPSKPVPGTDWHAWFYLREVVQLALVGLSLGLGADAVRAKNHFNYHAVVEVAALFLGIFICMQPALQILRARGPDLGLTEPWHYFWTTGGLSSVLDNAPTYVAFFETAQSLTRAEHLAQPVAGVAEPLLVAVSLGAVFMGAASYIGNGPNFMVKAIAETSGVEMPSFFGYLLYSGTILLPVLLLTTWLFL